MGDTRKPNISYPASLQWELRYFNIKKTRIYGSVSYPYPVLPIPSSALKSPDGQHCDDHDHHHGGNLDLPLPRDPDRQHCGEGRHMVGLSGEYAGGGLGLLTIPAALPLLLFLLPQSSSPPPPPAPQPRMLVLPNATLVPALLPSGRSPQPPPSSPPPPPCPSSPCQSLGLVTLLPVFTSLDGGLVRPRGLAHSSSEWAGKSAQQQQQARNWSTSFGRRAVSAHGTTAARLYPQVSTNFLMFRPCTSLLFHIPALYTCGTYFLQQNMFSYCWWPALFSFIASGHKTHASPKVRGSGRRWCFWPRPRSRWRGVVLDVVLLAGGAWVSRIKINSWNPGYSPFFPAAIQQVPPISTPKYKYQLRNIHNHKHKTTYKQKHPYIIHIRDG